MTTRLVKTSSIHGGRYLEQELSSYTVHVVPLQFQSPCLALSNSIPWQRSLTVLIFHMPWQARVRAIWMTWMNSKWEQTFLQCSNNYTNIYTAKSNADKPWLLDVCKHEVLVQYLGWHHPFSCWAWQKKDSLTLESVTCLIHESRSSSQTRAEMCRYTS